MGCLVDSKTHIATNPEAVAIPGALIFRVEEALTFTNMNMLKEMMWRLEQLGDMQAHPTDPYCSNSVNYVILGMPSFSLSISLSISRYSTTDEEIKEIKEIINKNIVIYTLLQM